MQEFGFDKEIRANPMRCKTLDGPENTVLCPSLLKESKAENYLLLSI